MTKVMIVDGGARGHILALAHLSHEDVDEVLVAPGNDGMKGNFINGFDELDIRTDPSVKLGNPTTILDSAERFKPDIIEVQQDDALAAATVDVLRKKGYLTVGPTRAAAQIEWSKAWACEFMTRQGIPCPDYRAFHRGNEIAAHKYASGLLEKMPCVFLKADGLYKGKGVVSATRETLDDALVAIGKMGVASETFLVEEGMEGEEFSYYALADENLGFVTFPSAQDNKRLRNRDEGPNTGGMGAISPALVTSGLEDRIEDAIMKKALEGLAAEGRPFNGTLYLGGMMTPEGPKVVEFNARWGDPECQVVLPFLESRVYHNLIKDAANKFLTRKRISADGKAVVCIVGAATGYPDNPVKDRKIIIDYLDLPKEVFLLSAGIRVDDGKMYTNGGRLFSVVAKGEDVVEARKIALAAMACCSVEGNGLEYRTDIGWRDVERVLKERDLAGK